jgi:hypothetical protein
MQGCRSPSILLNEHELSMRYRIESSNSASDRTGLLPSRSLCSSSCGKTGCRAPAGGRPRKVSSLFVGCPKGRVEERVGR